MAPRTRAQAQDDPINSMADTSTKKANPARTRTRKDPSKKSEEFDTPLPSVEDEQSALTFTQVSDNAPIGARTRSRSASANLTITRTQQDSRSITPAMKAASTSTTKRGTKRKQNEEDDDEEESGMVQRNKKARGNDHSDDTTGAQSTRAGRGGRGGRGRGRGGRGRGGRIAGSLQAIEESPAKQDDITTVLSAHPTQSTPSRVESKVDAPTTPSPFAALQLPSGSGKNITSSPPRTSPQIIQSHLHKADALTTPSPFAALQPPSGSSKYFTSPTQAEPQLNQSPLHKADAFTTLSPFAALQPPSGSGKYITSSPPRTSPQIIQSHLHKANALTTLSPFAALQPPSSSSKYFTSPTQAELQLNQSPLHKSVLQSESNNIVAPATLSSFGGNNVLRGRDGPSPSHASLLKSLKRSTSKRTRFEPYPMRQASPEKEYAYDSLSDSEVQEFRPGTTEWREAKVRWKTVDKFINSGDTKYLLKGVSDDANPKQRKPSDETSAQRTSMQTLPSINPPSLVFPPVNSSIPELRITDATLIEKLRAVAEWATSDASNTLPTVNEIKSLLEQAKSQVSASIGSPEPDVENPQSSRIPTTPTRNIITEYHLHPSGRCDCYDHLPENERPGQRFNVPFTPTDEESSDDESDMSTVVLTENASIAQEQSPLTPVRSTSINLEPAPPLPPKTPESKHPEGWLGSAKKALHSTFSFFGNDFDEGSDHTTEQEFTFTSSQKLPTTTASSQFGGRASRRAPQTEGPPRFNPALIPPEKFIPGSERRAAEDEVPLHMRDVLKSPSEQRRQGTPRREMLSMQEKQRQKQRETQEAVVADEVHETRKKPVGDYYFDPDEYSSSSESDPDETQTYATQADAEQEKKVEEVQYNIECPPEPMRDWQLDDEYGFTFKQYRRYSKLTHNPPDNPKYVLSDPPRPSWKSCRHPKTPLVKEWIAEHDAWKRLCKSIEAKTATQAEVDNFNAMIKRSEENRAPAAATVATQYASSSFTGTGTVPAAGTPPTADSTFTTSAPPPPTPRPANAALPSTVAKANPYAPKTPSRLRTAERAYSSSPAVIDEEVKHVQADLKADSSILRLADNRNEIFHPFSTWEFDKKDVASVPKWLN